MHASVCLCILYGILRVFKAIVIFIVDCKKEVAVKYLKSTHRYVLFKIFDSKSNLVASSYFNYLVKRKNTTESQLLRGKLIMRVVKQHIW